MREGRNLLIVGASSSIGRAILAKFCSPTNHVVATYCSNCCFRPEDRVSTIALDLSQDASIKQCSDRVKDSLGYIDLGIFLPSILPGKRLQDYTSAEIERVMIINFTGQAKLAMELLPLLAEGSQLIFVSSISAQKGSYDPLYSASKGAILSFVKSLAQSLAPRTRVVAIAPGLIEASTMFERMDPERRKYHLSRIPTKTFLQQADLATIIFDLSQDHWKHLNGACIDLNGGEYVR